MKKLLNIYRNYLKTQTTDDFLPSNWATVVRKFFQSQGINLEQFSLDDLDNVLMLQSIFNQKSLGQFQARFDREARRAGVGATIENNLILWRLGQFLVSQSYLSENPMERLTFPVGKMSEVHAEGANRLKYQMRELKKGVKKSHFVQGSTLTKYFLRPALALMAVIFISLFILKTQSKSPSENIEISALPLVKRVLASEKKPGLELIFTHPVDEKTVSNSASRVQNIFK